MTPIIQTESTVIGFLPDALSCVVIEEHNGIYENNTTPEALEIFLCRGGYFYAF